MPASGAVRLVALTLLAAVVGSTWLLRARLFAGNLHEVIPARVYRSAQLTPAELDQLIGRLGLRSVVNLRGEKRERDWFREQQEIVDRNGASLYSLTLWAQRLPPRQALRSLVEVLDRAERPTLIHCGAGTDRTGLASALAVLLEGGSLAAAREQFALRHGYVAALSPSDLRSWLSLYEDWLADHGGRSTPARLRRFVREGYTPYFYDAAIEALAPLSSLEAGRSRRLEFRITNVSPRPWRFKSSGPSGVRLDLHLVSLEPGVDFEARFSGPAPDRDFPPGASIVLGAQLPPLVQPGRYRLVVDLVDELVAHFADMGSQPLELEFEVVAAGPSNGGP